MKRRSAIIQKINFEFDIDNLKKHLYTAQYFSVSTTLLKKTKKYSETATMQFICFNQEEIVVAGIYEVIKLIKKVLKKEDFEKLKIWGSLDGELINKNDPILKIEGPYPLFAFLENIIDGILARRSSIATNCYYANRLLKPNQKNIYMADRTDDYSLQAKDGYPAYLAGINYFVTKAQLSLFEEYDPNVKLVGTMPHALIQQYQNNLVDLVNDFYETFKLKPTVLLDFENNVLSALEQLLPVFDKVSMVRLDTSKTLIDQSLSQLNQPNLNGVSSELVFLVREWLDAHHLKHIKIVVTSGISLESIKNFNAKNAPIDYYGIGSFFLSNSVHISADLVKYNRVNKAKVGRKNLEPAKAWVQYQ